MRLTACYAFQILGLAFVVLSGLSRKKSRILSLIFLANCCSIMTMFLAGRFDGGISAAVCTVRAFLFLFRDRIRGNGICWGCILAHIIVGVFAWQSPMSILVIIAPVVLTSAQWFGGVNTIKIGTIFSDLCWSIFDMAGGIYIEGLRDLVSAVCNLVGLFRARSEKTKMVI